MTSQATSAKNLKGEKEKKMSDSVQTPMGTAGKIILGIYLILCTVLLVYFLLVLWPSAESGTSGIITTTIFGNTLILSAELQLIILVVVMAALGSNVHAATSFATFTGNKRLYSNWTWWYILRLFIGVSLALIFYFLIRGGFLAVGSTGNEINKFGVAAVAGLVGMFSKQATDKLSELFDTLFKTKKSDERADKLPNPVPQIINIEPTRAPDGKGFILTINGSGFIEQSVMKIGKAEYPIKFISNTQLTVTIPDSEASKESEIEVTVFNPPPEGGSSNSYKKKVT